MTDRLTTAGGASYFSFWISSGMSFLVSVVMDVLVQAEPSLAAVAAVSRP